MRDQEPYPPYLQEDAEVKKRKKLIFDPTINLGHILTFVSFVIIGISIYSSLDKRVLILETSTARQDLRDVNQDTNQTRISTEMKDATIDIKHSVERLNEKLDRINDTRK